MTAPTLRLIDARRARHLAAAGFALALVACGSGSTAPKTGSLVVSVAAPAGVTPSVTVTGPNSYSQLITATTTLTGLTPGSYAVTAASVTGSNAIVGAFSTAVVSGSPATVTAGAPDTVTATYATRAGSGGLWVANYDGATVLDYTGAQLGASTSAAPTTALNTGVTSANYGVAFDVDGNLWVATYWNDSLVEFNLSALSKSGSPTAAVQLYDPNGPLDIAFDGDGNLWATHVAGNTVVEYAASQLSTSGQPTPAVTLSAASSSLNEPTAAVFDAAGDLWVANSPSGPTGTIVEFTPTQLTASGSPTPAVTITNNTSDSSVYGPLAMAFDASGNLWVANGNYGSNGPNSVVMFAKSQLTTSGTPTPTVILRATSGSLSTPAGLAFDASNDLWVSNIAGNDIVEYAASQLVSSGSPVPNATISGSSFTGPAGLAFNPHSSGLPIKPELRGAHAKR